MTDQQRRDLAKREEGASLPAEEVISLSGNSELALDGLTPEQIRELRKRHAEGMIDASTAAHRKAAEVRTLDGQLRTMAENTSALAASGQSVTITNTQENELGRTEIIMGTSDAARRGKLTRSQTGSRDYTLLWAGVVIAVLVLIAIIAMSQ